MQHRLYIKRLCHVFYVQSRWARGWLQRCRMSAALPTGPEECTARQHALSWSAMALMSSAAVMVATAAASARMHAPASEYCISSHTSYRLPWARMQSCTLELERSTLIWDSTKSAVLSAGCVP